MSVDAAPAWTMSRRLPGATVLQVVPALGDQPAARAAVNVASALLRSGARALVAGGAGMLVGQLQALGGEWVQLEGDTLNPFKLRRNGRVIGNAIGRERVDIVHAYGGPAAWSTRGAATQRGTLLVTTYPGAPTSGMGMAAFYQSALASGHRIITESEYAAELVIKRHAALSDQLVAIARSIDTARFDPSAVSAERTAVLHHRWGIRPGWRVVLLPGPVSPARGQMILVDAVRILVNGGMRGVAFVMTGENGGDEEYARAIGERIAAQGIGGLVRRVGPCPDMPAAYAVADLVVVPSTEATTFDPIAAEAQAMGKPVIASEVGSLPETVLVPPRVGDSDRTGWVTRPADPIELARTLAAALTLDETIREEIGRRGRHFAEITFSPTRVAAAVLAVYASLLDSGR